MNKPQMLSVRHPLSPVIGLGLRNPRKKEKKERVTGMSESPIGEFEIHMTPHGVACPGILPGKIVTMGRSPRMQSYTESI